MRAYVPNEQGWICFLLHKVRPGLLITLALLWLFLSGMRWQWAWREALWVTEVVGLEKAGSTGKGLFCLGTLSAAFWGWVEEVGWWISKADRAASYTARVRSG
jgi:hypothetical protein